MSLVFPSSSCNLLLRTMVSWGHKTQQKRLLSESNCSTKNIPVYLDIFLEAWYDIIVHVSSFNIRVQTRRSNIAPSLRRLRNVKRNICLIVASIMFYLPWWGVSSTIGRSTYLWYQLSNYYRPGNYIDLNEV